MQQVLQGLGHRDVLRAGPERPECEANARRVALFPAAPESGTPAAAAALAPATGSAYIADRVARDLPVPRRACFWESGAVRARLRRSGPRAARQPRRRGRGIEMANPFQFIQEVRAETAKVTWPSRKETLITTGMVLLMVTIASLFFVVVDQILFFIINLVLRLGQ
jgi:preprotein translocase subunit SecE